jgi:hypothetical protein
MTCDDTVDLMKLAAITYKKPEYEPIVKMADAKLYDSPFYQLTF